MEFSSRPESTEALDGELDRHPDSFKRIISSAQSSQPQAAAPTPNELRALQLESMRNFKSPQERWLEDGQKFRDSSTDQNTPQPE